MFISISIHILHISKPRKNTIKKKTMTYLITSRPKLTLTQYLNLQNNATGRADLPFQPADSGSKTTVCFLYTAIKIFKSFFCCKFCCPNSTQIFRQFHSCAGVANFLTWKIKPCICLCYLLKMFFNWNRIIQLPLFLCPSSPSLLPSLKSLPPTPKLISSFPWIILD